MISRKNRFHGPAAVSGVRGKSVHGTHVSIRAARSRRADWRLAVVVSKKVDNSAVVRNRIRRRLFELIRTSGLLDGEPVDVVVYAKSAAVAEVPFEELANEAEELVKTSLKCLDGRRPRQL